MEYMGNRQYWDEKFKKRSNRLLKPEKSLVENIKHFNKGSVLDIACGDGRNTMFLLKNNFKVTAIDFSSKALQRLERFLKTYKYDADVKLVDLTIPEALKNIGIFDNIVINHYRLSKVQIDNIKSNLSDKGILFICGFGHKHKFDNKIRECDLIQQDDFKNMEELFELINYVENEDERGFFVTYIFRKK